MINQIPSIHKKDFSLIRSHLLRCESEGRGFLQRLSEYCQKNNNNLCAYTFYFRTVEACENSKPNKPASTADDLIYARNDNIGTYSRILNENYYYLMRKYSFMQAELDYLSRGICSVSGKLQRKNVPIFEVEMEISKAEGIPPDARKVFMNIANSCWNLSKYGVKDGDEKIEIRY